MRVHPPASRLRITEEGSRVSVAIPSTRNWLLMIFLGFWLCGWLAGEVMVPLTFFGGGTPEPTAMFSLVWLAMWTLGGAMAITVFAWNLAGKEILSFSQEELSVRHDVGGLGFTRTYDVAQVSRLRVEERSIHPFGPRGSLAFWGLGGGRIAFDYGSSTVRFGYGLDDPDADRILDVLRRARPEITATRVT